MTRIIDISRFFSEFYNAICTGVYVLLAFTNIVVYVKMRHEDRQ